MREEESFIAGKWLQGLNRPNSLFQQILALGQTRQICANLCAIWVICGEKENRIEKRTFQSRATAFAFMHTTYRQLRRSRKME
jgi:hypothetical protein